MNRRDLLAAMLAGTATSVLPGTLLRPAFASAPQAQQLRVTRRTIEVNGKPAAVFGLQQPDGSPGLKFRAGEAFNVLLRNETDEATIAHWHGLLPPWPSDGVGDAPMPLIGAGTEREFNFPVGTPGTHWMHAHTLQEQQLLAAPLIVVDPSEDDLDEQEVVILLHDFSFRSPQELLTGLTGQSDMPPMAGMDGGTMDHSTMDMSSGGMAMTMDLNDIEYDAYLANDRTLDDPEVVQVERGGRIRLRIINGAAATAFTIDLGELTGRLTAVDGQSVEPVLARQFPLSMGQRIDLRVELPNQSSSFPILALREGAVERTGIILAATGATIGRLPGTSIDTAPTLDLQLESQLRAISPLVVRPADKRFEMTLGGSMAAYKWSLDLDQPILANVGDRIEVKLKNMSMMAHPMHLHGHHFQVVAIDGRPLAGAVRDTVLLPPMRSVTIAVDAENFGQWAFHCHHLYHMATGMMSTFGYQA
jgi:FtsP/CotA-like multicopper oxidase with cupredoxin domain